MCLITSMNVKIHFPMVRACIFIWFVMIWFAAAFGSVTVENNVLSVKNIRFEVRLSGRSLI